MQHLFFESIFSQEILRAFCWTLLHSCWQGLLLAMVTGLLILLTRRSAPVLRYRLLAGTFVLFFLTAGLTFAWELRSGDTGGGTITPASVSPRPIASPFAETPLMNNMFRAEFKGQWTDRMVTYFNEHAPLIVAVWFLVFFIRLVKIMAELGKIQRLKHYKTQAVPAFWKERIAALAGRLQIRRPVVLLESALIGVPMMAGVLKPVILVPMGLLAQLPPEQVEAILLHELAHIRRKDYFINLLQSFAEILFFFNPAVLWLSSLIREERENCCDDIAIEQAVSKKEFIHALVSFQAYSEQGLRCALAFPGSGNHLLKRVKRIVHRDDKRLSGQEKCFLLICLLIAGGLTMAFSRAGQRSELPVDRSPIVLYRVDTAGPLLRAAVERPPMEDVADTTPVIKSGASRSATPATGASQASPSGSPTRAIEASPSPSADTGGTDAREKAMKAYHEQQQILLEEQKKLSEQQSLLLDQQKVLTARQDELMLRYKMMALEGGRQDDLMMRQKLDMEQKSILENKLNLLEKRDLEKKLVYENRQNQEDMVKLRKTLPLDEQKNLEERLALQKTLQLSGGSLDIQRDKLTLQADQLQLRKPTGGVMHPVVGPVIKDLMERKLITNTEVLSFSLDKHGLVVNGVRQPAALFEIFKEKYLQNPGNSMQYFRRSDGEERIAVSQTK